MKYLAINPNIAKPIFDVPEGTYDRTQILQISFPGIGKFPIFYSLGHEIGFQKYWGPITINKSTVVRAFMVIGNQRSEEEKIELKIDREKASQKGKAVIIGGAEHCQEIHQGIIQMAGGPEKARIAFLPASSSEPYESGMDRFKRFSELGGLNIDYDKVPNDDRGEKDFSSILNNSKFWILPGALIDDANTVHVDESLWRTNGFKKEYAEKLRDGGYNIIFLSGGNQARYMKCLFYPDGTEGPVLSIIREIYEDHGGIVAGTSAGGAFLSRIMMLGGGSYGSMIDGVFYQDVIVHDYFDTYKPFKNRVWLGNGAGMLSPEIITDTHFIARGRFGRLITACLYLKKQTGSNMIGIGVDEDTAVVVHEDGMYEVVGASGALFVDTSEAELQTSIEPGRYRAKNIRLNYLEHGDQICFDPGSKSACVQIKKSQKITEKDHKDQDYKFEVDVFGKNRISDWLCKNLFLTSAKDAIGVELIDNLEDSSDSIFYFEDAVDKRSFKLFKQYYDLVRYGSALIRFKKTETTEAYFGKNTYHWWGSRDRYYPDIEKVEHEGFSFRDVYADVLHLTLLNFPDFSDGYDIPLKSFYEGREDDWREIFKKNKKLRLGMMVIPKNCTKLDIRVFFLDYAYCDDDRNGRYSPPRLMERYETDYRGRRFDYDIAEMDEAQKAKVFVDGKLIGETDQFGQVVFDTKKRFVDIRVEHESLHHTIEVEMKNLMLPITESVMKFSDRSY
jgi:cyanophycinase